MLLSVGEPVRASETSEPAELEALMPMARRTMPTTRRARAIGLFIVRCTMGCVERPTVRLASVTPRFRSTYATEALAALNTDSATGRKKSDVTHV